MHCNDILSVAFIVQMWQCRHAPQCNHMPKSVRKQLAELKRGHGGGGKHSVWLTFTTNDHILIETYALIFFCLFIPTLLVLF